MANTCVERYHFNSLEAMDLATKKAFGTHENPNVCFEKGLVLCYRPVGSKIFDANIRKIITECGGVLIE